MNKKDIFQIAKSLAPSLGLEYHEDGRVIIFSNNDDELVICPYTGNSNLVYLYIDIFNWDIATEPDKRTEVLNQINQNIDDCSVLLLPLEEESPNELRMIAKAEILLLSKSHFRKMLAQTANGLIATRRKYVGFLLQALDKLENK